MDRKNNREKRLENLGRVLQGKEREITEIVLQHPYMDRYYYKGRGVRIFGCPNTFIYEETPAMDILLNFDEAGEPPVDLIVCLRKTELLPAHPEYPRSFGPLDLVLDMDELLGCTTDVTTELGLKTYFPATYNQTLSTHKWDF